ncbi:Hypothetical protein, putative [Bodo saltans]|uniref:RNase III domain-containing protein n=1 Tax=Bodo saltans TaxID=75058 RepID=A0A0S4JPU3_BODSA|nr:Hypothetical protein, putative [Bodo saltans]|eukprot:CUG92340.1 Hypothetical protein, putative [Bodo saltans]
MICRTLFFRAALRPQLRLDRLAVMLKDQQVPNAPWDSRPVHTLPPTLQALFAPLFASNSFVFENHQLTMLGDTLVDKYLSEVLLDYFLDMGIVVTTNTAKLVNSVFHNHFSMRRLAEDIGLMNLSTPPEPHVTAAGIADLSFLEAAEAGPSPSDVAGTSFDVSLLTCGQSSLGWKFSHFIGALHRCYGDDAVTLLLDSLFGLKSSSNLVGKSTEWLYELVKRFSSMHVAEALLAAQGISAEFVGSSEYVGPEDVSESPNTGQEGKDSSNAEFSEETDDGASESPNVGNAVGEVRHSGPQKPETSIRGFQITTTGPDGSLLSVAPSHDTAQSLKTPLAGPDFINALEIWRNQALQHGEVSSLNELATTVSNGWLSPEEHASEKRGAAYRGFVDFSTVALFADVAGVAHPISGKRVFRVNFKNQIRDKPFFDKLSEFRDGLPVDTFRVNFKNQIRDKPFFDKLSEFRDGLPVDTNGMSVPEYLKSINSSHRRVFDVALVVDGTKVLGRATSSTYSEGRVAVSQAYLMRTLRDLSVLSATARRGEQRSDEA